MTAVQGSMAADVLIKLIRVAKRQMMAELNPVHHLLGCSNFDLRFSVQRGIN